MLRIEKPFLNGVKKLNCHGVLHVNANVSRSVEEFARCRHGYEIGNHLRSSFSSLMVRVCSTGTSSQLPAAEKVNSTSLDDRQLEARKKREAKLLAKLERQSIHLNRLKSKEEGEKCKLVTYDIPTIPGTKKQTSCPLPAAFSPAYVEAAWYDWWEKEGFFTPEYIECQRGYNTHVDEVSDTQESKKSGSVSPSLQRFTICLPPPNVTGSLHLGHALGCAIQDAIVRWHRMHGHVTLWNPGCDHAGIATQIVVEKRLWKVQRKTRHDIGREKFIEEVWKWKNEKGNQIFDQMKRLGSSLDWTRSCFTLDEKLSHAVNVAFIRLFDEGIIYRDSRLVNWSCTLKSAISDIEVDNVALSGRTYLDIPGYTRKVAFGLLSTFSYPIHDSDECIDVSTTRLETVLGDSAIAVHPNDSRYIHLHGRYVTHPLCDRRLPIICSERIDPKFGTGAMKLTPAHDRTDYDISKQYNLPLYSIMSDDGFLVNVPAPFLGMKRFDGREAVRQKLDALGLYRGSADHAMSIPICSRSKDVIEFLLKDQWYVQCEDMSRNAIEAVSTGRLSLIPSSYTKQWTDWLVNTKDWCISRQLWWGHRIPAYRISRCPQNELQNGRAMVALPVWIAAHNAEEAINKARTIHNLSDELLVAEQDEDVLDTWFSSALFPFSIFGWPDQTVDMKKFYPTDLLETAADIMFFWVSRMVMLGEKLTGQLPFNKVLFHSVLRDAQGRKMSKSLGNVIDPIDVIDGISLPDLKAKLEHSNVETTELEKAKAGLTKGFPLGISECGADALRFALCAYNFTGHFINVDVNHIKSTRHFCNKIWQAFRYTSANLEGFQPSTALPHLTGYESATDQWMLSRLSAAVESCDQQFNDYDLTEATRTLHEFWLNDFCDVYIEFTKPVFRSGSETQIQTARNILYWCIDAGLRLLSPFMPFITEELYQRLPQPALLHQRWPSISVAPYPTPEQYDMRDLECEKGVTIIREITGKVLSLRRELSMTKEKAIMHIGSCSPEALHAINAHRLVLCTLSRSANVVTLYSITNHPPGCVRIDRDGVWTVFIQLKDLIDFDKELMRMEDQRLRFVSEKRKLLERLLDKHLTSEQRIICQDKVNGLDSSVQRIESTIEMLRKMP